jgi:hypothetical protein
MAIHVTNLYPGWGAEVTIFAVGRHRDVDFMVAGTVEEAMRRRPGAG